MLSLGNKLTLNSAKPIYKFVNKYSIDFDGVDDRIITDDADTVAQPTTYSFWAKSSETGQNRGVFGHGLDNIGGFHFNWSGSNRPLLYLGSSYYVFWGSTTKMSDGEWHHWVVYSEPNNLNNCKLYCDGVLQTPAVTDFGNLRTYAESLTIGSDRQVGGNSFEGQIDEFAVYDRELTQAEITRMYNTYYSPNRVANGNFSQIGNEEVTNGDFSQEGSEQANYSDNNITFGNQSDSTTISLGSNSYRSEAFGNTGDDRPRVTINGSGIVTGKTYKVVYTPTSFTGSTVFDFFENNTRIINNHDASLPKTFYFVASGTLDAFVFDGSQTFRSDYTLSVKEVGQDWSFGATWSMGDGGANFQGSGSSTTALYQNNISLPSGKSYNIKFDISNATGNASIWIGNSAGSVNYFGTSYVNRPNGSYDLYFTMPSTQTSLSFYANQSGSNFTIDNISVKEVGQHWTFGTGWSTDGTKALFTAGGAQYAQLEQIQGLNSGATYKVLLDLVDTDSLGVYVRLNSGSWSALVSGTGSKELSLVAGSGNEIELEIGGGYATKSLSIDNIVVQELKHDATNLMLNAGAYQSANPLITSTKSMEFDGVDNYLIVNEGYDYNNRTFATWFNSADNTKTGTYGNTILSQTDSGGGNRWQLRIDDSDNQVKIYDGSSIILSGNINTTTIEENRWYNFVMTEDGTTLKFYINGIIQGSGSVTLLSASDDVFTFGQEFDGGTPTDFFKGEMTEAGVWDRVITDLEVASLYNQGMPTNLLVNRNNYQSGNPTVFNTKQVDFDGTDDYLDLGTQSANSSLTYSAWIKVTDTDASTILAYGNTILRLGNATTIDWWSDSNAAQLITTVSSMTNVWSHIVVTQTGQNAVIYLNGVQVNSSSSAVAVNTGLRVSSIGRYAVANLWYFTGEISQAGIWNEVLTADEVSSLYNHGLPIDLTTDQAAYESSSNLVGYWRMGSGTLDSYPLIADQTNATLGSDVIVNGDFNGNANNWTLQNAVWQQGSGNGEVKLTKPSSGNAVIFQTGLSFQEGDVLRYKYKVIDFTANPNIRIDGYSGANPLNTNTTFQASQGDVDVYIKTDRAGTGVYLYITGGSIGDTVVLDDISVQIVQGNPAIMTNQTSSDIENGSPYANLIINGTFDTDSDWSKQTGWSIANGVASSVASGNGNDLSQSVGGKIISGKTYKVEYTISNRVAGGVKSYLSGGGAVQGATNTTNGTHIDYLTAPANNTTFKFTTASGGFTGDIDNVTVSELNTGLQGYWKMGDGTNDEYPIIYDQTDLTLGSELITNGDFTDLPLGTGWIAQTGWVITSGTATCDGTNAAYLYQSSSSLPTNTKIIITVNITNYTSGTLRLGSTGIGTGGSVSGIGTHSSIITTRSVGSSDVELFSQNFIGSINNVSVKEVYGNPATMTNMVEGNITNQYPLTKIRNYYRMGDGILDGYPIIQDQTSPNLAHIPTTNLISNSNVFVANSSTLTTNYGISPDGTQNSTRVETSGNNSGVRISISNSSNNDFAYSVFVKGVSGETVNVRVETSPYSLLIQYNFTLNGEWQRVENVLTASNTHTQKNFYVTHLGGSTATDFQVYGSQIEEQSQATAYIKSDGIAAVRKSSTTNLITYSEDFSQAIYLVSNVTLESGFVSPFGTSTAKKLIEGTNNGSHFIYANVFLSGLRFFSVYLKKAERDYAWITDSQNGNGININLTNGTFTSINNPINPKIENVGNDWYRCSFGSNVSSVWQLRIDTAIDSGRDYQGDGTSGIYIFGVQLEEQTQAETYAPTYGLPVTIDLFTENNYGTMTNMSASDIVEDTPNN